MTRRNTARLSDEIAALKREIEVLRGGPAVLSGDAAAADATAAPAGAGDAEEGFASPWARAPEDAAAPVDEGALEGSLAARGDAAAAEATVAPSTSGETSEMPAAARESFESRIGARWAVWVGGIALALGGVFMVKYSIESGLISPAVRLSLAAVFGLVLIAAGEMVRRRAQPLIANEYRNAMIPGILTAAGAVTLFAVSFVSYAFYDYFGSLTAFVLLAAIAFATIGLSLLHGQALAGLGLLASMTTPLLVATGETRAWNLFGFLAVTWLATLAASRFRRWRVVPALANLGLCLWAVLYLAEVTGAQTLPPVLALLVMLAGVGLVWPGGLAMEAAGEGTIKARATESGWERLLAPPAMAVSLTAALAALFPALLLASMAPDPASAAPGFAILVVGLAILGASRGWAAYPAVLAGAGALLGTAILAALPSGATLHSIIDMAAPPSLGGPAATFDNAAPLSPAAFAPINLVLSLAAGLMAVGGAAVALQRAREPRFAAIWSVLMTAVPLAMTAISLAVFGNLSFDPKHGFFAVAAGLALLAGAEATDRRPDRPAYDAVVQAALVSGAFAFLFLSLFALTDGLATTLLVALLGALAVGATRIRQWPALPWMMVAAAIVVAARIAWDPTIVGPAALSRTPVFNQLLAGYGIPSLLLALAAWELRAWPGERVRNLLQALASLFVLLTAAILVRHAMNGGVLDSSVPTLGEQSIYTLLTIGASGVMMTLDLKSPSPIFRYGSMAVGVISMLSILIAHFVALNPYLTGELTGSIPFFNLLLIGYLLPGLAYAGLAFYARGRRPMPYVIALALTAAALGFAWVTLCVRRYWHGESIADWKGFLQGETYTYSVVWLVCGVLLLALGSRFDAKSIRLASAALVLIAVIKVFLIDMSNLEGILRALSFIGLGAVLIGIGLFYQKILSGRRPTARPPESERPPVAS
ncbi:MAG: DUF2339 domain-containing protein [Shinella sp.]|nr:DUF2339 domain-containing protein [Shinella sp.]